MFENRRWLVIPTNITGSINFDEVKESGVESLRLSNDGQKTFVKYDVEIHESSITNTTIDPETGNNIVTTINPGTYGRPSFYSEQYNEYTHQEILDLLLTPEWTPQTLMT
jgi:hypothetical protein